MAAVKTFKYLWDNYYNAKRGRKITNINLNEYFSI
jgi:hypothetical protein